MADIAAERARIARELHDGIAQDLVAIGYALDSEIGRFDTNPSSRQALRSIREQITAVNATVRDEIFRLRSARSPSAQRNLEASLASLEINFLVNGELSDDQVGAELGKVLLELVRNALAHGGATSVAIDITSSFLHFENDGVNMAARSDSRFGLVGISERLAGIGWELTTTTGFNQIEIRRLP